MPQRRPRGALSVGPCTDRNTLHWVGSCWEQWKNFWLSGSGLAICSIPYNKLGAALRTEEAGTDNEGKAAKKQKKQRNTCACYRGSTCTHAKCYFTDEVWTEAKMLFAGLSKLNKIRSSPSAGPADSRGQMPARNWKEVVYLHSMCQSIRAPQTKGVWIIDGAAA